MVMDCKCTWCHNYDIPHLKQAVILGDAFPGDVFLFFAAFLARIVLTDGHDETELCSLRMNECTLLQLLST